MAIRIKLWGVRGSIPCPGPQTVKYGGNTSCLELRFEPAGRLIIIDAGSGIRELGNHLVKHDLPKGPIDTELFLTHTHWDHIIGFPFFAPIYIPGTKLKVHGPVTHEDDTLDKIVGGQLTYRYFPVRQSELAADIEYLHLKECQMDLGDGITLKTKYLNHPILDLGYRFEYEGRAFCTAYDTEPFRNVFAGDPNAPDYDAVVAHEGEIAAREQNEGILRFYEGADLVIQDAQYTHKEYVTSHIGWGHTSFEWAINAANKANIKRVVLSHHDPLRTDAELDRLREIYSQAVRGRTRTQVEIAREQTVFEI